MERPILFSAPMVKAILAGSKSQTRRAVKPQPVGGDTICRRGMDAGWIVGQLRDSENAWRDLRCPYGAPGDQLWVRENGWERPERTPKMMREGADTWEPYYFDADGLSDQDSADFKEWGFKRRPSIHMPRKHSRILLEVTEVRVQRLQEISAIDSLAEGSPRLSGLNPQVWYRHLWDTINGHNRAITWGANPWIWAISFKRI